MGAETHRNLANNSAKAYSGSRATRLGASHSDQCVTPLVNYSPRRVRIVSVTRGFGIRNQNALVHIPGGVVGPNSIWYSGIDEEES